MHRTKGQIKAELSEAIIKFEKEDMGRGPLEKGRPLLETSCGIHHRMQGEKPAHRYQHEVMESRKIH